MSNYTAKDLDTLRRQAQEIEKVLAAQQAARQQSYAARQTALASQRESDLRQAYISRQQALAQLPAQLAQAGINGGLAESSFVQLNRGYGSRRADINSQYAQGYMELQNRIAAEDAQAAAEAAQNRIDYLGAESALQAQLAAQQAQQAVLVQMQQAQLAQQAAWEDQLAALQAEMNSLKSERSSQQPAAQQQTQSGGRTAASVQKSAGRGLQHTALVGHTALVR